MNSNDSPKGAEAVLTPSLPQTTTHETARYLLKHGFAPIPVKPDGTKQPATSWGEYHNRPPTLEQIDQWFSGNPPGIGVVCGAGSGNLEMLELEPNTIAPTQFLTDLRNNGHTQLADTLETTVRVESGGGGFHYYYRLTDTPPGSTKLAHNPDGTVMIETRGQGAYAVTAPTKPPAHKVGDYLLCDGDWATIATLTPEQHQTLHQHARSYDQKPKPPPKPPPTQTAPTAPTAPLTDSWYDLLTDHLNQQGGIPVVLVGHGWTYVHTDGEGRQHWRRPGKHDGTSATITPDGQILYVFYSNTPFPQETPLDIIDVSATLAKQTRPEWARYEAERTGIHQAWTARQTVELVYHRNPPAPTQPTQLEHDQQPQKPAQTPQKHAETPQKPLTWSKPVKLTNIRRTPPPQPAYLKRSDGQALIYPAKLNVLLGEPESGKTWLAMLAAKDALKQGHRVAMIDYEDTPNTFLDRCDLVGITELDNIQYHQPDLPIPPVQPTPTDFDDLLNWQPHLVIIDAWTESLQLEGLDQNSGPDIAEWIRRVARPFTNRGAAVLILDHVTKSKETRGDWPIGSQHKKAAIDGAAYTVQLVERFGRATTHETQGQLIIRMTKDRPGAINGQLKDGKTVGTVTLTFYPDNDLRTTFDPAGHPLGGTAHRTRILQHLATNVKANKRELRELGNSEAVDQTIQQLIAEGLINVEQHGRAQTHHLTQSGQQAVENL